MSCENAIIGAGPIGLYLAYKLKRKGINCEVYEEHKEIGKPVACSGLLTKDILKQKEIKKIVKDVEVNQFKGINLNLENNEINKISKKINLKNNDILVDRFEFDKKILELANSEDVKIHTNKRLVDFSDNIATLISKGKKTKINYENIIGCDGPNSCVGKTSNLVKNRKHFIGLQGISKGKFNSDKYDVNFNSNKIKDFYWWSIPENEKYSRIGLASQFNPKIVFNILKEKYKLKTITAGLIPIYKPFSKSSNKNVFLVGDAAGHVKNTTGGGIVPGLVACDKLVNAFDNDKNISKKYEKSLFDLHLELTTHFLIRKILNNFNSNDYSSLFMLTNQNKIQKKKKKISRDYAKKLAFSMLVSEPRYFKFLPKLFF